MCNCGGSTRPTEAVRLASQPNRRGAAPPVPLRSGGPADRSGSYYAKTSKSQEHNGPAVPDRA